MFIVAAACIGLALIVVPGWMISNYQAINALGTPFGLAYIIAISIGAILLLGSIGWTVWKLYGASLAKKLKRERRNLNPSDLSSSQKEFEIDENLRQIDDLRDRAGDNPELAAQLDPLVKEIEYKRKNQTLEIVAFGTISSGKSSVLNLLAGQEVFVTDIRGGTTVNRNTIPWPTNDKVTLVDTPGIGEVDGADHVAIAAESAKDADLVLVVVDGPLRQSEHDLLDQLGKMEKRVIICLNKADWYSDENREKLKGQIRQQTADFVEDDDVIAIQAQESSRTRHRVMADGTTKKETVTEEPDIAPLANRMVDIVRKDGKELLMANVLLQSRGLVEKARDRVQRQVDEKAWDIVEKYMWGAGGVAAVNPFPFVDLIAGSAISTKMILDLADVYNQKVDLDMARTWIAEMGKNLIGFLGAQGAAVAISSVAASLVKSVPFAGSFAGGVMQGAIQALVTKWIGSVFIDYFRNEMQTPEGGLSGLARRHWEKVTAADELRKFLQSARSKLSDDE